MNTTTAIPIAPDPANASAAEIVKHIENQAHAYVREKGWDEREGGHFVHAYMAAALKCTVEQLIRQRDGLNRELAECRMEKPDA